MSLDYAVEQLTKELMERFALPTEQARMVAQWHLIRVAQAISIALRPCKDARIPK